MIMRRLLSTMLYTIYLLLLLFLFLHMTFPYKKLEARLTSLIEKATSSRIMVGEGGVRFPLGLVWKQVGVTFPEQRGGMTINRAEAKLSLLPLLLSQKIEVRLFLEAPPGEAWGDFWVERRERSPFFFLRVEGEGFDLARVGRIRGVDLEGIVALTMENEWEQDFFRGTGTWKGETRELAIRGLKLNGIAVPDIRFSQVVGRGSWKGGLGSIEEFSARGREIDLIGGGTFLLREDWGESLINLSSQITVKGVTSQGGMALLFSSLLAGGASQGPIPLVIKGTIRHPQVFLNGVSVIQ